MKILRIVVDGGKHRNNFCYRTVVVGYKLIQFSYTHIYRIRALARCIGNTAVLLNLGTEALLFEKFL